MNFALARLLLVVSSAAVVWADDHANLGKLDWELMNACADGNASEVRRLLAAGASATVKTPDGETPLHVAGISGNADVAKALIQSGAELNSRVTSKRGLQMTPLTWFAYGSHKAGVEALLEAGANPDAIVLDEAGNRITALDIAHKIEAEDVVKVLVNHRAHKFADMSPDEARANAPRTIDLGGEL